ncbi:hypothetical protein K438DRAFT_447406 [Mycena galopus ATCC 62051]|nr:hypothetical protein K438DRAFT_447406 [Mycena galopus ATCC 62051]
MVPRVGARISVSSLPGQCVCVSVDESVGVDAPMCPRSPHSMFIACYKFSWWLAHASYSSLVYRRCWCRSRSQMAPCSRPRPPSCLSNFLFLSVMLAGACAAPSSSTFVPSLLHRRVASEMKLTHCLFVRVLFLPILWFFVFRPLYICFFRVLVAFSFPCSRFTLHHPGPSRATRASALVWGSPFCAWHFSGSLRTQHTVRPASRLNFLISYSLSPSSPFFLFIPFFLYLSFPLLSSSLPSTFRARARARSWGWAARISAGTGEGVVSQGKVILVPSLRPPCTSPRLAPS